jgi:hypothetical protein
MSLLGGTYGSRELEVSSNDAKRGDDCLQADFAILIVGAMPGFCCVSSNKQQRRCNGCPVHSISKRNYEASSRNLSEPVLFDFRFAGLRR